MPVYEGSPVHTERLLLRRLEPMDIPALVAIANDWDVVRMLARLPFPAKETDKGAVRSVRRLLENAGIRP